MASLVSVSENGSERLVISCQPSSRSWVICFGMYNFYAVMKSILFDFYSRTVCQLPMRLVCILLCAKAGTAVAHLSHCNSVSPSVTRVDQSKTMQAEITKSLPSASWKTLVLGSIKLFSKYERGHPQ